VAPCSRQARPGRGLPGIADEPERFFRASQNWTPFSVGTVWIGYGAASIRAVRKPEAVWMSAFSSSPAKASSAVRSPPGPAGPVSSGERIGRLLTADRDEEVQFALP
jgi:hypothetical protein